MGAPCLQRRFRTWKNPSFPGLHVEFRGVYTPVIVGMARLLGTVGEPINPEAWRWYYRVVGGVSDGEDPGGSRWLVVACWGFWFGWWWCFFLENMEKKREITLINKFGMD